MSEVQEEDLVVGFLDPNEELTISENLYLKGNLYVRNNGVLNIECDEFKIEGNIYVFDSGKLNVKSEKFIVNQDFTYQYSAVVLGDGGIYLEGCEFSSSGHSWGINALESGKYSLLNSKVRDGFITIAALHNSEIRVNNSNLPGEFLAFNSSNLSFVDSDSLLVWLILPDGSEFDVNLPGGDEIADITFSEDTPGIDGIDYEVNFSNCTNVMWGAISQSGCNATFRNTKFRAFGVQVISEDSVYVRGLTNHSQIVDEELEISDRSIKLIDCDVQAWNFYANGGCKLRVQNSVIGELISYDSSQVEIDNSVVDGSGGYIGSEAKSEVIFIRSIATCQAISRDESVFIAAHSALQGFELASNDRSVFLLANSSHFVRPQVSDTSAMFIASLPPVAAIVGETVTVCGKADIITAPENPMRFEKYDLSYRKEGSDVWILIEESSEPALCGELGVWNTEGLEAGRYDLLLRLYHNFDDVFGFEAEARLFPRGVVSSVQIPGDDPGTAKIYPNPAEEFTTVSFTANRSGKARIEIIDLEGVIVKTIDIGSVAPGETEASFSIENLSKGAYFARILIENRVVDTEKFVVEE